MYSEGSDIVPQSNETALHYFKKAADMVRPCDSVHSNVYHVTIILVNKFIILKDESWPSCHKLVKAFM